MTKLALRNLFHDRVRLLVTLTGVVFAVVLMGIQIGLFLGFVATTANLIDHSGADLWIASSRIQGRGCGIGNGAAEGIETCRTAESVFGMREGRIKVSAVSSGITSMSPRDLARFSLTKSKKPIR